MNELVGRVAIVTGGARGIGAAIVRDFVARGAKVVVVDNGASIDGRATDSSVATTFTESLGTAVAPLTMSIAEPGAADAAVKLAPQDTPLGGVGFADNQSMYQTGYIGELQPDGQFKIIWSSPGPIKPQPYDPLTFPGKSCTLHTIF